ncbi:MAG TPA: tRNA-dihydrouridine synthase, partial [Geobacteraceae bacterium]
LPLTVKIRTGWTADSANFLEIGRIAEGEGCDAVTLHPRSRAQMFEGRADWAQLRALRETLAIPVLGSGDLFLATDVVAMLAETGCAGVMLARGALGNPWLFRESLALLRSEPAEPPTPAERLAVARRHLELFVAYAGERVAVREMRKQLSWYVRGVPGAAQFRHEVNGIAELGLLVALLDEFFMTGEHGRH